MEKIKRIDASPEAVEMIDSLKGRFGDLVFHQSGGCCDGSAPMCFEKGDFKLKIKNVDLHLRIERALSSLGMQAQNHGIKIYKEFNATHFNIQGDEVMLTNLIFNMVDNAIKYFRPGDSFIKVRTYNNEWNQIIVEIEDNGIGISKEHQNKVFDKLFRVPTGNVHNVKGYGLGLSYVKSIIDHHHGSITVTSKLNEGSKFIITLPLNQPKE